MTKAAAVATAAVCRLHLEGFGDRPGLKKTHLSCIGGSITAAAHPDLLAALGPGPKGVLWSQDKGCQDVIKWSECQLVVCGPTVATLLSPTIASIHSSVKDGASSLCITAGAKVAIMDGTFSQGRDMRPVLVAGDNTTALISGCRFVGNRVSSNWGGGVSVVDSARVNVQASHFLGNQADCGGAISTGDNAEVTISSGKEAAATGCCTTLRGWVSKPCAARPVLDTGLGLGRCTRCDC